MSVMPGKQYHLNSQARTDPTYRGLFHDEEYSEAHDFFHSRPHLRPTPLRHLRALAREIGVRDILLKDESARFGLNAFKILGVSYVMHRLLSDGRIRKGSVVVCATEGNHGRAVARAAAQNHLAARVYVPAATVAARVEAIRREGAEVLIVDGNYDEAVRRAAQDAEAYDWTIVSDTSWPGYELIPRLIAAGYTRLLDEAEEQWGPEQPPDVVVVQAGVGGLACAVASWLCQRYGARRPFTIACEPASAACLLESARAGKPVSLSGPFDTVMAGLRCGEVSPAAWPVIAKAIDAFVTVDDEECAEAMRILAHPGSGDAVVEAGASGACGLAALRAILREESLRPVRDTSGLNARSRVFVINTEGATDTELYARITGNDRHDFDSAEA